jgi:hypothetical protein
MSSATARNVRYGTEPLLSAAGYPAAEAGKPHTPSLHHYPRSSWPIQLSMPITCAKSSPPKGALVVIPTTRHGAQMSARHASPCQRHLLECYGKLKQFRRRATDLKRLPEINLLSSLS